MINITESALLEKILLTFIMVSPTNSVTDSMPFKETVSLFPFRCTTVCKQATNGLNTKLMTFSEHC